MHTIYNIFLGLWLWKLLFLYYVFNFPIAFGYFFSIYNKLSELHTIFLYIFLGFDFGHWLFLCFSTSELLLSLHDYFLSIYEKNCQDCTLFFIYILGFDFGHWSMHVYGGGNINIIFHGESLKHDSGLLYM